MRLCRRGFRQLPGCLLNMGSRFDKTSEVFKCSLFRVFGKGHPMRVWKDVICLAVVFLASNTPACSAGVIRLDTSAGSLGGLLDGVVSADLGTSRAGPFLVPGLEPLSLTVVGLEGISPIANATSVGFGINSLGADVADRFDADLNESIDFVFNTAVTIQQLDFRNFSAGEVFEFAGFQITNDDLSDRRTDVFDFTSPLRIGASVPFTLQAVSGSIGLQSISLQVEDNRSEPPNRSVPEPSTAVMFVTMLLSGWRLRRRQHCMGNVPVRQRRKLAFLFREPDSVVTSSTLRTVLRPSR